jgi:putative hydrolase of the HAD superfamily
LNPHKTYQHLFFDLDHTLWDYERSAAETLTELHGAFGLANKGIESAAAFVATFKDVNQRIWALYDHDKITQADLRFYRFRWVFDALSVADYSVCDDLNAAFLEKCARKPHLIPQAKETLEYLYGKYPLHLITNGFEDVQRLKISSSGIEHYFNEIITSQRANAKKPHPQIFEYALGAVKSQASACLMIGDNLETDVKGAVAAQIDVVHYNPESAPSVVYSITHLNELTRLL